MYILKNLANHVYGFKYKQETGFAPVPCRNSIVRQSYAVNEVPQPQLPVALGFLKVKPEPMTPLT